MEPNGALNGQGVEPELSQTDENQPEIIDVKDTASMQSLLDEQGLDLKFPKKDEVRKGTIATIREDVVMVSIGTKSEGIISGRELEQIPREVRDAFEVGEDIPVYIIAPEDQNGNVVLSYTRAREENDWDEVDALLKSNEPYELSLIHI